MTRRHPSSAFTLLELVLVLLIIATVITLAAPALAGFARGRAVSDAATTITSLAQYARDRAKSEGQTYRLVIDADARKCSLTHDDGTGTDTFIPCQTSYAIPYTLPTGIAISCDIAVSDQTKLQQIDFLPAGTCDVATIHLSNDHGNTVDISCLFPYDSYHITTGPDAAGGAR